jgi:hypothetical protein
MELASLTFHLSQSIRSTGTNRECVRRRQRRRRGYTRHIVPYGRLRLQKISGYMKDAGKGSRPKTKDVDVFDLIFHRIVLDEAHVSSYRRFIWLTGTVRYGRLPVIHSFLHSFD